MHTNRFDEDIYMRIFFTKEELNNLTVAELIDKFSKLPLNARVNICGDDDYILSVSENATEMRTMMPECAIFAER